MNKRLPNYTIPDYLAEDIQDGINRQYIGQGSDSILIGGSMLAQSRGRIKSVFWTGTTDTTIEIYINNQPQFVSGRPAVLNRVYQNPNYYTYNRGDVIKVLRTAGLGVGGTAVFETEDHELIKRAMVVATPGRDRLKRAVERAQYLPMPDSIHILQETWSTFREATSKSSDRAVVTQSGGSSGGVTRTATYAESHSYPGGHNTGSGTKPKPGGPRPGWKPWGW